MTPSYRMTGLWWEIPSAFHKGSWKHKMRKEINEYISSESIFAGYTGHRFGGNSIKFASGAWRSFMQRNGGWISITNSDWVGKGENILSEKFLRKAQNNLVKMIDSYGKPWD